MSTAYFPNNRCIKCTSLINNNPVLQGLKVKTVQFHDILQKAMCTQQYISIYNNPLCTFKSRLNTYLLLLAFRHPLLVASFLKMTDFSGIDSLTFCEWVEYNLLSIQLSLLLLLSILLLLLSFKALSSKS